MYEKLKEIVGNKLVYVDWHRRCSSQHWFISWTVLVQYFRSGRAPAAFRSMIAAPAQVDAPATGLAWPFGSTLIMDFYDTF